MQAADDAPAAIPDGVRLQRAWGAAEIRVEGDRGATRLRNLFQDGCAKIRLVCRMPAISTCRSLGADR